MLIIIYIAYLSHFNYVSFLVLMVTSIGDKTAIKSPHFLIPLGPPGSPWVPVSSLLQGQKYSDFHQLQAAMQQAPLPVAPVAPASAPWGEALKDSAALEAGSKAKYT